MRIQSLPEAPQFPRSRNAVIDRMISAIDFPPDSCGDNKIGSIFTHLDRFACEWSLLDNTGPIIQQVYSLDDLSAMLPTEKPPVRKFGLIMLRLALTDEVPTEAIPLLQLVFTDYYDNAPLASQVSVAKGFLAILPDMAYELRLSILPTGTANQIRSCTEDHLIHRELMHYQEAIALLSDHFEQEDVTESEGREAKFSQ
jgi:hypothetical protein